jgi:hypothetical protein
MRYKLPLLLLCFVCGCIKAPPAVKIGGDDQFAKIEAEEMNAIKGELNGLKGIVTDLTTQITANAQIGVNNKTLSDQRQTKTGRDAIFNDPKLIREMVLYGCGTVVAPFILIIAGFVAILIVIIVSNERRHGKQTATTEVLINNISDSQDKLIDVFQELIKILAED